MKKIMIVISILLIVLLGILIYQPESSLSSSKVTAMQLGESSLSPGNFQPLLNELLGEQQKVEGHDGLFLDQLLISTEEENRTYDLYYDEYNLYAVTQEEVLVLEHTEGILDHVQYRQAIASPSIDFALTLQGVEVAYEGQITYLLHDKLDQPFVREERLEKNGDTLLLQTKPLNFALDTNVKVLELSSQILDDQGHEISQDELVNGSYAFRVDGTLEGGHDFTLETNFLYQELASLFLEKNELEQGDFTSLSIKNPDPDMFYRIEQDLYEELTFYNHKAYLPVTYHNEPGTYEFKLYQNDQFIDSTTLKIKAREFPIQYLYVDPTTDQNTRNDAAYEEYYRYFPPSRAVSSEEDYTDGPYILPVEGRLTTEFGQRRFVNDAPTSYRHSGLDIAAPTGTPVLAANRGKVTLSMELIMLGNIVVLDHGQGFFSIYYHMNERNVIDQQMVDKGQQLGTVGSTGFSTGPHLHFIISHFSKNLDPGYVIYQEALRYDNYEELFQKK